jgi:hypothetical protein
MRDLRSAGPDSYGTACWIAVRFTATPMALQGRHPSALGERFRHEDEVARPFRLDLVGEGGCAGFDVA